MGQRRQTEASAAGRMACLVWRSPSRDYRRVSRFVNVICAKLRNVSSESDHAEFGGDAEKDLSDRFVLALGHEPVMPQCLCIAEVTLETACLVDSARPSETMHGVGNVR